MECFNPSVGILGGQTCQNCEEHQANDVVSIPQSGFLVVKLGPGGAKSAILPKFQSLSRDSWWSNHALQEGHPVKGDVSIPQSGFLVVKPDLGGAPENSPTKFQSLSRDSWWSNLSSPLAQW